MEAKESATYMRRVQDISGVASLQHEEITLHNITDTNILINAHDKSADAAQLHDLCAMCHTEETNNKMTFNSQ